MASRPSKSSGAVATDAERECAYDRKSSIGKLDTALDEAQAQGWTIVYMKQDWKTIFPPDNK